MSRVLRARQLVWDREMDSPGEKPVPDLRDYLAEERTFLAWIRTGIALIGLGFVTTRLGLFVDEAHLTQNAANVQNKLAFWLGTALILMGVVVNLASAWRHMRLVTASDQGQFVRHFPSLGAVTIALLLALLGGATAICLILLPT
jgi:putative membrane protein